MFWIYIVPIALLLIGLTDLPIGYYTLLRIVVCIACAYSSYTSYKSDEKIGIATVTFAMLAIIFNPVIPIYLGEKGIWAVIDILTAALLAIKYYTSTKKRSKPSSKTIESVHEDKSHRVLKY